MISYERQEFNEEGQPRPVKVITDDANAEMAAFKEMIVECEFQIALPTERDEDGNFSFIIPGQQVGEFAECVSEIDYDQLEQQIEEWNAQMIEEATEDK